MNPEHRSSSRDTAVEVVDSVRKKGVQLWSDGGQLRFRAPKGALTHVELQRLREFRASIIEVLENCPDATAAEPEHAARTIFKRAPMSFSQLIRWQRIQRGEVPCLRQVVSATRVLGRLDVGALRRSLSEVLRRHDALRTRIVVIDGVPLQEISPTAACELETVDIPQPTESAGEREVMRCIEEVILDRVDLGKDPLLRARLIKRGADDHVLILAMEHLISDGRSKRLLLREVLTLYAQSVQGRPFSSPQASIRFADFAAWQRSAVPAWIDGPGRSWCERLMGSPRLRFPQDASSVLAARTGWAGAALRIPSELKRQLQGWCRLNHTTLAMSMFTAYSALVLRWCNESQAVLQYQTDGRFSARTQNVIGYFASMLYIPVQLSNEDSFFDLLHRVTAEYCTAYDHADSSYLAAVQPRPGFTRNPAFNWQTDRFNAAVSIDCADTPSDISCTPIRFTHPVLTLIELDSEPAVSLIETDDEILGDVYFPLSRFAEQAMQRFASNLVRFAGALVAQPHGRVKDISLS